MDSVTQLVLGASVGHAVGGRSAGRKAIVAGAIGGTIPDLDVVFYPLLDSIQQLGFHRGISHSFLFVVVASPVFGWIARKISREPDVPMSVWMKIGFWALLTHVLLDSLTVYGTGLFEPFSNYRVAFNSIFIIDPLFTIPLIVGLIPAVFKMRRPSTAHLVNVCGLAVATAYLGWTLAAKSRVDRVFEAHLEQSNIEYRRMMTTPTAFNSLLWRALAQTDDGFIEGYYSIVAGNDPEFESYQSSVDLPARLVGSPAVRAVNWFSKGYCIVEEREGDYLMHDLRFGTIGFEERRPVFTFRILSTDAGPGTAVRQVPASFDGFGDALGEVWAMILGRT